MHPKYSPVSCKYLPCPGAVHLPLSMFTALLPITDPFCSSQLYSSMRIPGLHGNNTGGERDRIVNKRTEKNSTIICRDRSDNRRVWFRKQRKYSFLNCNRETKTIFFRFVSIEFKTKKDAGVTFRFRGKTRKKERKKEKVARRQVDIAETTVTLIARKPAAEEETSLVNIEGIKATLLMEWAFKGRPGIGPRSFTAGWPGEGSNVQGRGRSLWT